MVTQLKQREYLGSLCRAGVAVAVIGLASGCDKMPLLAPSGSVITLFPASTTVAVNGEVEIVATVIENGVATTATNGTGSGNGTTPAAGTSTPGAGTPVQNGTLVSFTTTIGRIEPREARTNNGEVRVRFIANGQSGQADITAYSGGTVGRLATPLKVGSAAVERVLITASPQTLGASGGTTTISARVEDVSGLGLSGVPVNFTTDAGTLSASSVNTDSSGVASVTLNTTRQSKVTANVAGKTSDVTVGLNPRTGISITPPATSVSAGQSALFTVSVSATSNIRDVTVSWGDGSSTPLGALSGSTTVPHVYQETGTYQVRATATDASGFSEPAQTAVFILPAQPPGVIVTPSNTNPSVGETVIVRAQVSGNTSSIIRYEWNFGSGATPATAVTTGNQTSVFWSTTGTKGITVTAVQATGPSGDGAASVVVKP